MKIKSPDMGQEKELGKLWKLVFGDPEDFIRDFLETAYDPACCRLAEEGGRIVASLYWFDAECRGQKLAYLYAVGTHPDHRGRGLCRALMENTHRALGERGYAGALLMPAEPGLRKMYAAMGYQECTAVAQKTWTAHGKESLRPVTREEYVRLRRQYLPEGGVVQEGRNLALLQRMAGLYAGEDFLLAAAQREGKLWGLELLGNREKAPGILGSLGCDAGTFRFPGDDIPFAMFLPLRPDAKKPEYFGLAFD